MCVRIFAIFLFLCLTFSPKAFAVECLTIFSGASHQLLPHDERFINIPTNSSTDNLVDNTALIRGDNFYQQTSVSDGGTITVAADNGSGKPAILYLSAGVSWVNVKINANGQAKDLIIYVNSAINISGDDTDINAIIYVNGTITVTDEAEISGALAAIANISISTEAQVTYEQSGVENSDFNGMCGNNVIPMCAAIFPGSKPFSAITPLSNNSEFKPISECNDSQCVLNDVVTVLARNPTIPAGGSDLGELNKASLSDEDYNFYSGWKSNKTNVVYSGNSGTAVIYIKSTGDVKLPDKLKLNKNGDAANVLLVIESSTKIEIGKESEIQAFMYLVAPEIKINEDVDIEGGITVDTDKLIVEKDSEFEYDDDDLEGFNPHGFCRTEVIPEPPVPPVVDYCEATFVNGATSHGSSGKIKYENSPTIYNNGSAELASKKLEAKGSSPSLICDGFGQCTSTGTPTAEMDMLDFLESSDKTTIINVNSSVTLGDSGESHFGEINVFDGGTLNFSSDFSRYRIEEINILESKSGSAVLNLAPGDYYIGEFESYANTTISIVGTGAVRIFLRDHSDFEGNTKVNVGGNVEDLLLYGWAEVHIKGDENNSNYNSEVHGFIYSKTKIELKNSVKLKGAASAGSELKLKNTAEINYVCNTVPQAILNYRFDECAYTGVAGDVFDQQLNFNGTSHGNPSTIADSQINQALDLSAPGTSEWLHVPKAAIDGLNDFSIALWFKSSETKAEQNILHALGGNVNNDEINLYLRHADQVGFKVNNKFSQLESTKQLTDNIWHHLVVTREKKDSCLYIDGELQVCDVGLFIADAISITNDDAVVIGQEQDSYGGSFTSPESFEGKLDEFKVFDSKLSSSDVTAIYENELVGKNYDGSTRAAVNCPVLHHFEIDTIDGAGITCEADNITIKACADASCSIINPDAVDVKLSINGTEYKTVTVSGANGTTTSYPFTTVGQALISLDQTYECTNTSGTPCTVAFKDSGFIISEIPMQISGKPSDEGFNATMLSLRAVETNTTTGVCMGAFPDGGDIPVNLSYSCDVGSTCTNNLILNNNGSDKNITQLATAQDLRFSTDSTASFSLTYPDAGKLTLNAQKDVEVINLEGITVIKDFSVSSNAFVERPFAFKLDFSQDANSGEEFSQNEAFEPVDTGSPFKKAGETFKLTATAVQWQSGQDNSPYDGVPDDFRSIDGNDTAEYFVDGKLTTVHALVLPEGANAGNLTTKVSNVFSNSIITNEYSYDEVGILKLNVNLFDNDYLGVGNIFGEVTNVGRFTPAFFIQTVESNGKLNASHYEGSCEINNWAYAGQRVVNNSGTITNVGAIGYKDLSAPMINITAYNLSGAITQNYTESGFMKLLKSGIDITSPVNDELALRVETSTEENIAVNSDMSPGEHPVVSGEKGIVTYTFNATDHFIYEHTTYSRIKPFDAKIPFTINAIQDSDVIKLYNPLIDPVFDPVRQPTEKVITDGVEIRFGRWLLENSYGPETSRLPVTMFVQHYVGTAPEDEKFINNEQESCLVPTIESEEPTGDIGDGGMALWKYRLGDLGDPDNLLPSHTSPSVDDEDKTFTAGVYQSLFFSAPDNGSQDRQGSLAFEYQVPPWLQYDWNGNGNFTNNPTTRLTFGVYRGNDRIIYQREVVK